MAVLLGTLFLLAGCGGQQEDGLENLELTDTSGTEEDKGMQEESCGEEETYVYVHVCGRSKEAKKLVEKCQCLCERSRRLLILWN